MPSGANGKSAGQAQTDARHDFAAADLSLFPPAADSDSFADGRFMACFGKIYVTFL